MKNLKLTSIFGSSLIAGALALGTLASTPSAAAQSTVTAEVMAAGIDTTGGFQLMRFTAYNGLQMKNVGECWQMQGPFATQDTAWRRWREARDWGYQVSNGIYRCDYDGYCFTVFFPC